MTSVAPIIRPPRRRHRGRARPWLVAAFGTMLLASSAGMATSVGATSALGDAAVVSHWNQIAQATFLGDSTKKPQEHFLYLSFLNIAIYDAVVGIHGRYQSYGTHTGAPAGASDEAAVAAAAHHVLETYSSYAQGTLD